VSVAENFSIHLPDPLLADLDAFAQTRQTSRSGVIREANICEFRRVEGLVVEGWLA
jgi:metal-responsive CopG/Arc/MetJ family transcriptional regulator